MKLQDVLHVLDSNTTPIIVVQGDEYVGLDNTPAIFLSLNVSGIVVDNNGVVRIHLLPTYKVELRFKADGNLKEMYFVD